MPTASLTPLSPEQQALVCLPKALDAVEYWAHYYDRRVHFIPIEEFRSEGYLALCHAARRYRPRGVAFPVYASFMIRFGMSTFIRNRLPIGYRGARSFKDSPRTTRLGRFEALALPDTGGDPTAGVMSELAVADLVAGIWGRDRALVVAYYTRITTMKALGAEFGITESRISQLLTNALAKLREYHNVPRDRSVTAKEGVRDEETEESVPALPPVRRLPAEGAVLGVLPQAGGERSLPG